MVCKIPEDGFCFFVGSCQHQAGILLPTTADLKGTNACFDIHADYRQGPQEGNGQIEPFIIVGTITPQNILPVTTPDVINFKVTGKRKRGEKAFYASGKIGKYTAAPFRIDCKARPSSDIVDIMVWLPSQALLANRVAK